MQAQLSSGVGTKGSQLLELGFTVSDLVTIDDLGCSSDGCEWYRLKADEKIVFVWSNYGKKWCVHERLLGNY